MNEPVEKIIPVVPEKKNGQKVPFDRKTYQREYMRDYRKGLRRKK